MLLIKIHAMEVLLSSDPIMYMSNKSANVTFSAVTFVRNRSLITLIPLHGTTTTDIVIN